MTHDARVRPRSARRRAALMAALAIAGVTALAGCGGSDGGGEGQSTQAAAGAADTSSAALQQAAEDAKQYTAEVTSFDRWDPGAAPKPSHGLRFGAVTCLWSVPACKRIADGLKEAGDAIGWKSTVIDGTPDPSKQVQAVQSLLTNKSDVISLAALDPNGIGDLLEQANTRGIPWVGVNMLDPTKFGAAGNVDLTGGLVQAGKELGTWVADAAEGKAKILMMSSTDNPALQLRDKGFEEYLKQFPEVEFKGKTIYVPFKDVGPPLQAQVSAILQSNPPGTLDYVYTPFDGFATFVVNAIEAAGRDDVKVVSFDGSPQNLDFIREGRAQVATQATAWGWCAWTAVHAVNRALGKQEFIDKGCPSKVIDKTNAPPKGEVFDGDIDYKAEFRKRWGAAD